MLRANSGLAQSLRTPRRATLGPQRRIDRLKSQYRSPERRAALERQQWRDRLGNADADKCRIGPRQGAKRTDLVAAISPPWPHRHVSHRCLTDTGSGAVDSNVARPGGSRGSAHLRGVSNLGIAGSGSPRVVRVDDHVRDQLKEMSDAEGVTLSEFVRDLLLEAVVPAWRQVVTSHRATIPTLTAL